MFVFQLVGMGSSALIGRRSSELRPTHVTCKSEHSHVAGTDGYSLLQFGNVSTLHGIYFTYELVMSCVLGTQIVCLHIYLSPHSDDVSSFNNLGRNLKLCQ